MPDNLVSIPVSVGELIDKITILEIKDRKIADPGKLGNVRAELAQLRQIRARLPRLSEIATPERELQSVNTRLWEVEDDLRELEARADFGARFVELARSVYKLNDRRAALKYAINLATGSTIVEEKSYAG